VGAIASGVTTPSAMGTYVVTGLVRGTGAFFHLARFFTSLLARISIDSGLAHVAPTQTIKVVRVVKQI